MLLFQTPEKARAKNFRNHILVLLPTLNNQLDHQEINFLNFIMPLRLRHYTAENYHAIVILGNSKRIRSREWKNICNFPDIYFVQGNPLVNLDMLSVNPLLCFSCVVLSQPNYDVQEEEALQDREVLLCVSKFQALLRKEEKFIPITTELGYSKNTRFFSTQYESQIDCHSALHHTEPYARGLLFNNSLLFSCVSSFYFHPDIIHFYRSLFYGEAAEEVDEMLDYGEGFQSNEHNPRNKVRGNVLKAISLFESPLKLNSEAIFKGMKYSNLWQLAIQKHNILCLGLYRLNSYGYRFVFTNPPGQTEIWDSDQVFCFIPCQSDV